MSISLNNFSDSSYYADDFRKIESIPKKGSLSEYKSSYLKMKDTNKYVQARQKDSLTFSHKNFITDPSYLNKEEVDPNTTFPNINPLRRY